MAIVEVHINNKVLTAEEVSDDHSLIIAQSLFDDYHIEELRTVGIEAYVYITGLQSKMNDEGFEITEGLMVADGDL